MICKTPLSCVINMICITSSILIIHADGMKMEIMCNNMSMINSTLAFDCGNTSSVSIGGTLKTKIIHVNIGCKNKTIPDVEIIDCGGLSFDCGNVTLVGTRGTLKCKHNTTRGVSKLAIIDCGGSCKTPTIRIRYCAYSSIKWNISQTHRCPSQRQTTSSMVDMITKPERTSEWEKTTDTRPQPETSLATLITGGVSTITAGESSTARHSKEGDTASSSALTIQVGVPVAVVMLVVLVLLVVICVWKRRKRQAEDAPISKPQPTDLSNPLYYVDEIRSTVTPASSSPYETIDVPTTSPSDHTVVAMHHDPAHPQTQPANDEADILTDNGTPTNARSPAAYSGECVPRCGDTDDYSLAKDPETESYDVTLHDNPTYGTS